jgi:hypothetical protein
VVSNDSLENNTAQDFSFWKSEIFLWHLKRLMACFQNT